MARALENCTLVEVPGEAFGLLRAESRLSFQQIGALLDQRQRQGTVVRSSQPVADGLTAWWSRDRRDCQTVGVLLKRVFPLDLKATSVPI